MKVTKITLNYGSQTSSIELLFWGGEGVQSYMQVFNCVGAWRLVPLTLVLFKGQLYMFI